MLEWSIKVVQRVFSDPHMRQLARVVKFTPKDLERNRRRRLSRTQIKRLDRRLTVQLWIEAILFGSVAIVIGTGLLIQLVSGASVYDVIVLLPLSALTLVMARISYSPLSKERASLRQRVIEVSDVYKGQKPLGFTRLHLNRALHSGQLYRVYYTRLRLGNQHEILYLLSIEPRQKIPSPIETMTHRQEEDDVRHSEKQKSKHEKRKRKPKRKIRDRLRVFRS